MARKKPDELDGWTRDATGKKALKARYLEGYESEKEFCKRAFGCWLLGTIALAAVSVSISFVVGPFSLLALTLYCLYRYVKSNKAVEDEGMVCTKCGKAMMRRDYDPHSTYKQNSELKRGRRLYRKRKSRRSSSEPGGSTISYYRVLYGCLTCKDCKRYLLVNSNVERFVGNSLADVDMADLPVAQSRRQAKRRARRRPKE